MSKTNACISLSRVLPISKLEQNINAISSLVYNYDDVLDSFLQKVDQPLIINYKNGNFICCEYNREGDSYRFPGTKNYFPPIEEGNFPSEKLLNLEIKLNELFRIYTKFYYSENAISNVFCYAIDEDNEDEFVVAVLISNKISNNNSNNKTNNGKWESSNLLTLNINREDNEIQFNLISSVNVYLNANLNCGIDSKLCVGGSLTKSMEKKLRFNGNEPEEQFLIDNIGTLIEDLETRIRDEIEVIYFQKTTEIIDSCRHISNKNEIIRDLRNIMK